MYNLNISLPTVNEKWIEDRVVEFSVNGINEFRSLDKAFWSDEFDQRYEHGIASGILGELRQHNVDCRVIKKIPEAVKSAFRENGMWEVPVTSDNVDEYNQAISDAIDMVAELYAIEFAIELRCKGWWK